MKKGKLLLLILLISTCILCACSTTFAHPGSLDKKGGHYDHSTGEYHYHTGDHTDGDGSTGNGNSPETKPPTAPDNTTVVYETPTWAIAIIVIAAIIILGLIFCARHYHNENDAQRDRANKCTENCAKEIAETKATCEEKLNASILERDTLIQDCHERSVKFVDTFVESNIGYYRHIAACAADFMTIHYNKSAEYLEIKSHPAPVEAKRIEELQSETKTYIAKSKEYEYKLNYITMLYPRLKSLIDNDSMPIIGGKPPPLEDVYEQTFNNKLKTLKTNYNDEKNLLEQELVPLKEEIKKLHIARSSLEQSNYYRAEKLELKINNHKKEALNEYEECFNKFLLNSVASYPHIAALVADVKALHFKDTYNHLNVDKKANKEEIKTLRELEKEYTENVKALKLLEYKLSYICANSFDAKNYLDTLEKQIKTNNIGD